MNFSVNGQNVDAAFCRVKRKRQGCRFYVAVSLWLVMCFPVYAEAETVPVTVKTESDCDKAAMLDLRVVYEDESLSGLVAPPAGVYPFEPGDGVVLRAYGMGEVPVTIEWSGDIAGSGETQFIDMDDHKRITVTFKRADQWPEKEAPPWFDVAENKNYYAFLGGGDLYGWFAACRHEKKGAGITHLTHRKAFLTPVFHITSLNFEHIISGAYTDNYRSVFTPRTDPMRFRVESPGKVCVRWPKEEAAWDVESEMIYCFDGKDAIDITFNTVFGKEAFAMGYAGFMWATYQSNFKNHVIYFPGISEEKSGWMHYGPTIAEDRFGGTIAFKGSTALPLENGANAFNVIEAQDLFFSKPYYYGLLDMSIPESSQQVDLVYAMFFDQETPIRFAVWNWGDPPGISAWDWQYVVHDPEPGARASYRARMVCAELDVPAAVSERYENWRGALDEGCDAGNGIYPEMPVYWSPSSILFDPLVVGECMERHNPDHALTLYREALITLDDAPRIATKMDELLSHEYGNDRRVEEWLYILDRRRKWVGEAMPVLLLAHAYHDNGNLAAAIEALRQGILEQPDNAAQLFFYGELLLEAGETAAGIEHLAYAIEQDGEKASPAGELVAGYAEQAAEKQDMAQAELLYRMAAELAPDDHWHKVHLGELLEKQGREEDAEALYRSVLLVAPESPYTAQLVDDLYQARNDAAGQIRFWRDIHEQKPDAAVPLLHLGKAYYDQQDYENAASVLKAAQMPAASNAEIRFYLGAAKVWLDQEDAGIALIKAAVKEMPILTEPAATVFAARAKALMESGAYAIAEKLYRESVTLVSTDIWYPVYLGEALAKQGKDEDALALFIKGMDAAPDSPYIAELIHHYFLKKGNMDRSIQVWEKIVEKHPDVVLPKVYLVRACYERGDYEKAASMATQMKCDDSIDLILYRCASMLYLDSWNEGRLCLIAFVDKHPAYASQVGVMFSERAQMAADNEMFPMAECFFRDAIDIAPDELWHKVRLAEMLYKIGRDEDALETCRSVLLQVPDSPYTANLAHNIFARRNVPDAYVQFWRDIYDCHSKETSSLKNLVRAYYHSRMYEEVIAATEDIFSDRDNSLDMKFFRCAAELRINNSKDSLDCLLTIAAQDVVYAIPVADVLAAHGDEAFASKQLSWAEELYQQAAALSSENLGYLIRLGEIAEKRGNYEEALNLYVQVLNMTQDAPKTAALLDALLVRAFDSQRRIDVWTEVHTQNPDAALPLVYLGKAQEAADNHKN